MQQPAQQSLTLASGLTLAYLDLAPASSPLGSVLFLHGSGPGASGWSNFKFNAQAFIDAGYRVVIPDLPGYGDSDKPMDVDYTLDYFVTAVEGLVDHLKQSNLVVIGNSLGGAIAQGLALAHPERVAQLILMAPGGIEEREVYFNMTGIQEMVKFPMGSPEFTRPVLTELLKLLVADAKHVTPELVDERWDNLQKQNSQVLASMQIPNLTARLAELTMPILVFWGSEDQFCPASGGQKYIDHCNDAQLHLRTRCGHWVMVEYPDEFNSQSLAFIGRSSAR